MEPGREADHGDRQETGPPTGLRRRLWRLPIVLYRLGLVPLLSGRVMLLTHVGRVSACPAGAGIEMVQRDERGYVAASGSRYPPRPGRRLCRITGFAVEGSVNEHREVGSRIPFVRFGRRGCTAG
ncbi:hypothetical protein [Nonomuraea sp. NPDC049758]|uniref:hypothetical protein n=1 Tax=Nonomuraea sp. NPDC049758 TaxID=3154360 RepID=UPI003426A489